MQLNRATADEQLTVSTKLLFLILFSAYLCCFIMKLLKIYLITVRRHFLWSFFFDFTELLINILMFNKV